MKARTTATEIQLCPSTWTMSLYTAHFRPLSPFELLTSPTTNNDDNENKSRQH